MITFDVLLFFMNSEKQEQSLYIRIHSCSGTKRNITKKTKKLEIIAGNFNFKISLLILRNFFYIFVYVLQKPSKPIRRLDIIMLTHVISAPIPFLTKDRGYSRSLILDVIDLLVIQCQRRFSTDALTLLEGSWNELVEISYLTYYLLYMSHNWWNLNILLFSNFTSAAKQLTSQISHMLDYVVTKWWSAYLNFKTNILRSSRYFCVV